MQSMEALRLRNTLHNTVLHRPEPWDVLGEGCHVFWSRLPGKARRVGIGKVVTRGPHIVVDDPAGHHRTKPVLHVPDERIVLCIS